MSERDDRKLSTEDIAASADRNAGQRPADPKRGAVAVTAPPGRAAAEERERKVSSPSPAASEAAETPLFAEGEAQGYTTRWDAIQTGFVDEPRKAVEEADTLVAEVMKKLAEVFAKERSELEKQWDRGDRISTEDLRVALRRYRSFFQRLLSV